MMAARDKLMKMRFGAFLTALLLPAISGSASAELGYFHTDDMTPLYSWWSGSRGDNFATTNPRWTGNIGDTRTPGYNLYRIEGGVFKPDEPQRDGTVPLYSWYSPSRGDNFITSDPKWAGRPGDRRAPDYQFVRLEGYVADPSKPQPNRFQPLYSWWNGERGDNFSTTNPQWSGDIGTVKGGYKKYRLEGYVYPLHDVVAHRIRPAEVMKSFPGDRDGDGLPDEWEKVRANWGLDPDQANLLVVAAPRPGLSASDLRTTLVEVSNFFESVPVITSAGKKGIKVVYRSPANQLDETWSGSATPLKNYKGAYDTIMPRSLIGYARPILVDGVNGGGQSSSANYMSVAANSWEAIVHELGHTLTLCHNPVCDGPGSPFYTSLMNYDYSYSFNGDAEDIHFSRGRFSTMKLNEKHLNEELPFNSNELSFLTKEPYRFNIREIDNNTTSVDFNRNRTHSERNVIMDLNAGYALGLGPVSQHSRSAGDVAIAALGRDLVGIRTVMPNVDLNRWMFGASKRTPGGLAYEIYQNGRGAGPSRPLVEGGVIGSPSVYSVGQVLVLAYPTEEGIEFISYRRNSAGHLVEQKRKTLRVRNSEIVLADFGLRGEFTGFVWRKDTKRIQLVGMNTNLDAVDKGYIQADDSYLTSNVAPGVAWNSKSNIYAVVTTTGKELKFNAVDSSGKLKAQTPILAGQSVETATRPVILFDPRGETGNYITYYRNEADFHIRYLRRYLRDFNMETGLPTGHFDHGIVINEWSATMSPPAIAPYGDDYAYFYRRRRGPDNGPEENNKTQLYHHATGILDVEMTLDKDDVHLISQGGLASVKRFR